MMDAWKLLDQRITGCEHCSRLRDYCQQIATVKRRAFMADSYWGKPVPNFGDPQGKLLIVGLAPAAHGANRTGRMFTGDRSGEWLYRALHKAGFANQPTSQGIQDGLRLRNCYITAVCHCAPPDNKPTRDEIENCRPFFRDVLELVPARVFLALGHLAWQSLTDELVRREWLTARKPRFGHGVSVPLADDRWLVGAYHPSQQNTFTGRLTEPMFDAVFREVRQLLRLSNNKK